MSEIWIVEQPTSDWRDLFKPLSTEGLFQTVLRGESIDSYYSSDANAEPSAPVRSSDGNPPILA